MVERTTDRRSVGKNGYGVLLAKKKENGLQSLNCMYLFFSLWILYVCKGSFEVA